jgi:hypothetical protein
MKERCLGGKKPEYLGVNICDRWLDSFENFIADMGEKPSSRHTLDRINPSGDYEPSNCRWATPKEQAINRRSTIIPGTTVADACRKAGISRHTFWARRRLGLPIEICLKRETWRGKKNPNHEVVKNG